MNYKLEQWRNMTEREKHSLAVIGASVLTLLVVVVWGYAFFNTFGNNQEAARDKQYNDQFSPLAPLKNLFSENIVKIKEGFGSAKNSASAIFSGEQTATEINQ